MSNQNGMMVAQVRVSSAESVDRLDAPRGGGRGRHHGGGGHGHGRPFRGGRGYGWYDSGPTYFQTDVYPVTPITTVEEEIAFYIKRNQKIFVTGPNSKGRVSGAAVTALQDRGWSSQTDRGGVTWLLPPGMNLSAAAIKVKSKVWDVQPDKMIVRDVDHFQAWTPTSGSPYGRRPEGAYVGEIEIVPDHDRPSMLVEMGRINGLGRYSLRGEYTIRAEVRDIHGRPFSGITVQVSAEDGRSAEGTTNSDGTVVIPFSTGVQNINVIALLPEGPSPTKTLTMEYASREIITFRSVESAPQPIVNTLEALAGGGGLLLLLAGIWLKSTPVQVIGEIGMVSAVFNRVGRAL